MNTLYSPPEGIENKLERLKTKLSNKKSEAIRLFDTIIIEGLENSSDSSLPVCSS